MIVYANRRCIVVCIGYKDHCSIYVYNTDNHGSVKTQWAVAGNPREPLAIARPGSGNSVHREHRGAKCTGSWGFSSSGPHHPYPNFVWLNTTTYRPPFVLPRHRPLGAALRKTRKPQPRQLARCDDVGDARDSWLANLQLMENFWLLTVYHLQIY